MGKTYAIGDLHGRLDVLEKCLERIERHRIADGDATGENTTIVFLGDYIDRGKESKKVVELLMAGPKDKATWVTLAGNHEEMALMAHADPDVYWKWWTENGGLTTSMNYPDRKIDQEHLNWFSSLPTSYIDPNGYRLFVHAGIKRDTPLHLHTQKMLLWVRYPRNEEVPMPIEGLKRTLYVVHGHTPWMDGPVVLNTRCNLDTKSYATGMAAIAVFDDDVAGQPIEMMTALAGYAV